MKMQKLVDKLNEATRAYDEGHPLMTDEEWDKLYFELVEIEKNLGKRLSDSPTQKISYEVINQLKKVKHNHKMLSLNKTKDIDEVKRFAGDRQIVVMAKMDGLTCSLRYVDGKLISAETRGNGVIGEDVLHNAKVIKSIPKKINYKDELIIDGEIICTYSNFEKFSSEYKNPRNFAAGSIRLLDSKECASRNLDFVAWNIVTDKGSHFENLYLLDSLGFLTVPSAKVGDVSFAFEAVKESAKVKSYPIDGLVIKYDNLKYGASLGETTHHPNNAIAFKFYDETYQTELLTIAWTMGRTGVLTPVAVFEPIEIDGTIVSRASLHNLSVMKEIMKLPYERQKIWVSKRNQIIPYIEEAESYEEVDGYYGMGGWLWYKDERRRFAAVPIHPPKVCPICGKPTVIEENDGVDILKCGNPQCEGKSINKFDHFVGKKGLDIKGLSKATIEKLMNQGWLNNYSDIFELKNHKVDWVQLDGFGEKSVSNILNAIESAKDCSLESFISAIGIPLIGSTVAKDLIKYVDSYEDFRNKIENKYDFSEIFGFGESMQFEITHFDYKEADKVALYLNIENKKQEQDKKQNLQGKTIVITGKLNHFKNRDELKAEIASRGGKVAGSVSAKTDYLINNDKTSTTSKNVTAANLGISILSEDEFLNLFDF